MLVSEAQRRRQRTGDVDDESNDDAAVEAWLQVLPGTNALHAM
jgi:hypothetical protein